ncbi:hypothetical protein CMV_015030, partial [Castanea mollissima]
MDEFSMEVHHGGKLLNNPIRMPTVSLEDGGLRPVTTDNDDLAMDSRPRGFAPQWNRMALMGQRDGSDGSNWSSDRREHCVDVPNIIDDVGNFTQSVATVGAVGCDASFDDVFKGYDCDMDEGDDINISDNSEDSSGSDDDAFDKLVIGPVDLGQASKEQDSNMVTGSNAKIVTGFSDNRIFNPFNPGYRFESIFVTPLPPSDPYSPMIVLHHIQMNKQQSSKNFSGISYPNINPT